MIFFPLPTGRTDAIVIVGPFCAGQTQKTASSFLASCTHTDRRVGAVRPFCARATTFDRLHIMRTFEGHTEPLIGIATFAHHTILHTVAKSDADFLAGFTTFSCHTHSVVFTHPSTR